MIGSGEMPLGNVLLAPSSNAQWLAASIFLLVATWCLHLPDGSLLAFPPISSSRALIWRRHHPLLFELEASIQVDREMVKEGNLDLAYGFEDHHHQPLSWRSYGAIRLPVFTAVLLPFLVEGRPPRSSWLGCQIRGNYIFCSEFTVSSRCCKGLGIPSDSFPMTARLDLDRSCFGPNCNFSF